VLPAGEGKSVSQYPRPQLQRQAWSSLDGQWDFSFDACRTPEQVGWTHEITVPFSPESKASGVHDESFHPCVWYRRRFQVPPEWQGRQLRLHFGAVDYRAEVWVNGQLVTTHEGGHTPFWADISHALVGGDEEVVVRAEDDPAQMDKPRGKQDWLEAPHGIWYPRTTGIWQPVWLEPVSEMHLSELRLTPDAAAFGVTLEAWAAGPSEGLLLDLTLRLGDEVLVQDTFRLTAGYVKRTLHLPDPGIDDARRRFLWSPEQPTLLDLDLKLRRGDEVLDEVESYTALRSVEARGGSFYLNERPYFLRLALDQGYWDDSLLAAPSPEALKRDVELAKAMGFNGVRKHQKLEDPRYLYWADRLGLLVWTELPSAYAFTPDTGPRLTREWLEAIKRDYNHPCVVAWVAFNESWGVPDLPLSAPQRQLVAALYHLTKSLDATRPVVGNDGWEHVATDLLTIHDYHSDPVVLRERYGTAAACAETSLNIRPAGRDIVLGEVSKDVPVILSEFGGVRYSDAQEGWGYQQVESPEALLDIYRALIQAASSPGLAGFCYTQFADTFQEQNGLLYSDRTPKVPLEELLKATAQRRR
jgi:beta-galactosidase/beta-glucuronidase